MAQLTNANAAERKPMRLPEGPQPLDRLLPPFLGTALRAFRRPERL
jgi:hypothetical protein